MAERYFGELPGFPVGSAWPSRREVAAAGVHRPLMNGISGTRAEGADSIVVSGGYEDDEDLGTEIIYTGAGGNDPSTGRQVRDQDVDQSGIAGLITSELEGLPVRVVRGRNGDPAYSPTTGFRYDGLFRVAEHWSEVGKSGFRVWRFRLVALTADERAPYTPPPPAPPTGNPSPPTTRGVTTRVVRETMVSRWVKDLYDRACQVCDETIEAPGGPVSEGAHIRGLGKPHEGPDEPGNVLCLCPNHHSQFDRGGIWIDDQLRVHDFNGVLVGPLTRDRRHTIGADHLRYHREHWGH